MSARARNPYDARTWTCKVGTCNKPVLIGAPRCARHQALYLRRLGVRPGLPLKPSRNEDGCPREPLPGGAKTNRELQAAVPLIHGWRLDVEKLQRKVCDEKTFRKFMYAASHTACGRKFGSTSRRSTTLGPRKVVTCSKCIEKGCR